MGAGERGGRSSALPEPLILSLDIGTSSTRALLWNAQGQEVPGVRAQIPYQMHTTPDGGVEMPAEELLNYVIECLDRAMPELSGLGGAIQAIGISSFWHSLLGL